MNDGQVEMLKHLQELEFCAIDLNLFLDTHPGDHTALKKYNQVSEELMALNKTYQEKYGPHCNFGMGTSEYPWRWVQGPWPWEIEYPAKG